MIAQPNPVVLPTTLDEFLRFEPNDGHKYEWNDGELIVFGGIKTAMKKKHLSLIQALNLTFDKTKAKQQRGQLIGEQDVMLTGIQVRRPDVAYFSNAQIHSDEEAVPAFCIEVISPPTTE
jgi:Uma2 family endonuclease